MKAVALDLDGTLLTSTKDITKENIETLEALEKKGVKIIIVTGRPIVTAKKALEPLKIKVDLICGNGAVVYDVREDKIIEENLLQAPQLKKIIEFCREKKQNLNIYKGNHWFAENSDSEESKLYKKGVKMDPVVVDFKTLENENVVKTILIGEHDHLENIKKELEDLMGDEVYMTFSQERYLEVLNKDVNKGKALKRHLERNSISLDECIAFGDAPNDEEMLKIVGIGVTMGNAHEEVKTLTKYTTDTNDNSGVAKFLEKYL